MKITKKFGIAAVAGALTLGGAATAFGVAGNAASAPSAKADKGAFVCAHLDQIKAQEQLKEQLLTGRITLLKEARETAVAADNTKAVVRIDKGIVKTAAATNKLHEREAKVEAFAAAHCATDGTPTPMTTA
jgi:hypothetical protein